MKKETFDYICSIGSSCLCATALRDAGLRLSSGPFDWLTGTDFRSRIEFIVNDFASWLERGDFKFAGKTFNGAHDSYVNTRTGIRFLHDFDTDKPFEACYDGVRAKYERRIERFYERIRASKRVLLVWVENPVGPDAPSESDIEWGVAELAKKFPGVRVELLIVDRSSDTVPETDGIVWKNGYGRAACPFRKPLAPGQEMHPWDIEMPPLLQVFESVAAADYRSGGERRAHREGKLRARRELVGARNAIDYLIARLEVKLCKFCLKRLRRRGADLRWIFQLQLGDLYGPRAV